MKKRPLKKVDSKYKNRFTNFTKPQAALIFVGLVAAVLLGNYAIHKILAYPERKKFDATEKQIDLLSERIVAEFGEPVSQEKSKSCGYASRKFSRGPLSCSIESSFTYKVSGAEDAEKLIFGIDSFIEDKRDIIKNRTSELHYTVDSVISVKPLVRGKNHVNNISSSFEFVNVLELKLGVYFKHALLDDDSERLTVELASGMRAKAEHYPVR